MLIGQIINAKDEQVTNAKDRKITAEEFDQIVALATGIATGDTRLDNLTENQLHKLWSLSNKMRDGVRREQQHRWDQEEVAGK